MIRVSEAPLGLKSVNDAGSPTSQPGVAIATLGIHLGISDGVVVVHQAGIVDASTIAENDSGVWDGRKSRPEFCALGIHQNLVIVGIPILDIIEQRCLLGPNVRAYNGLLNFCSGACHVHQIQGQLHPLVPAKARRFIISGRSRLKCHTIVLRAPIGTTGTQSIRIHNLNLCRQNALHSSIDRSLSPRLLSKRNNIKGRHLRHQFIQQFHHIDMQIVIEGDIVRISTPQGMILRPSSPTHRSIVMLGNKNKVDPIQGTISIGCNARLLERLGHESNFVHGRAIVQASLDFRSSVDISWLRILIFRPSAGGTLVGEEGVGELAAFAGGAPVGCVAGAEVVAEDERLGEK